MSYLDWSWLQDYRQLGRIYETLSRFILTRNQLLARAQGVAVTWVLTSRTLPDLIQIWWNTFNVVLLTSVCSLIMLFNNLHLYFVGHGQARSSSTAPRLKRTAGPTHACNCIQLRWSGFGTTLASVYINIMTNRLRHVDVW